ncbi:hypothetical protein C8R46DRAFT_882286 [Mycena filopes]|nr:hypothetical protein C8R46DRAFT_882286 [Mycena filopes]
MSPVPDDFEQYKKERAALISRDRSLRPDFAPILSETEIKADLVVRKIRAEEAVSIWDVEYPDIQHPFPGMEFLTARSIILKSKLFEIITKMPKGALLHVHLDATVDAKLLLQLGLEQPAMHVRVPERLTSGSIPRILPEFRGLPQEDWPAVNSPPCGLTDPEYVPNTWVQLRIARDTFDTSMGSPEGFNRWVAGALSINPAEAYGTHKTVDKIWKKFGSIFKEKGILVEMCPISYAFLSKRKGLLLMRRFLETKSW